MNVERYLWGGAALPGVVREGLWEGVTFEPNYKRYKGNFGAKFGNFQPELSP